MNEDRGDSGHRVAIGVDIGGTFTDGILVDPASGRTFLVKLPSTPADSSVGFMNVIRRLVRDARTEPDMVGSIVHGTTVATNAIIEGNTARTAFVTTRGFRDMLEIARQIRPSLYDLQFEKPPPLVPRHRAFEISERLDATGSVIEPVDMAQVDLVARRIGELGVEAVAICLLHAYANPAHEALVASRFRMLLPDTPVSVSSEIAPEFREYYRASTTVVNAAVQPIVARYLAQIEAQLLAEGFRPGLLVMQSSGGVMSFSQAASRPVFMIESGPAAGVVGAVDLSKRARTPDVISFDMGGTTAKIGLIRAHMPSVTKDFEVGGRAEPGVGGVARGSGYPIRTPVVELVEIGAGGGSIAWIDDGGALRVGPRSAGADPGPACYGRGGHSATITDAHVVLGRIGGRALLGGELRLDEGAAHAAVASLAAQLGDGVVETAHAVVEIANVAMMNAIRLVSVQRGYDPREFALIAFGGAGPLHANRLATLIGIPRIVIPAMPGAFSASGLLSSDMRNEVTRTLRVATADLDPAMLRDLLGSMADECSAVLRQEGIDGDAVAITRYAEMRYGGQSYELLVPLPVKLDGAAIARLEQSFHDTHRQAYGFAVPSEATVVVNLRVQATADPVGSRDAEPHVVMNAVDVTGRAATERSVYFGTEVGFLQAAIWDRSSIPVGSVLVGPLVIDQEDSTIVIEPGYEVEVDALGSLIVQPTSLKAGSVLIERAAAQ